MNMLSGRPLPSFLKRAIIPEVSNLRNYTVWDGWGCGGLVLPIHRCPISFKCVTSHSISLLVQEGVSFMPIYTYRCENCGVQFERRQTFSDDPLKRCPECNKNTLRKVYLPVGIVFKGSGFYATDNRSPSGRRNTSKSSSEESSTSSDSSESTGTSTKSETSKAETTKKD
jgi:putative FmdB family regulatory protein